MTHWTYEKDRKRRPPGWGTYLPVPKPEPIPELQALVEIIADLETGQCEAWCWTHDSKTRGSAPIRRCSRQGIYDGLSGHVLCLQHADAKNLCFTEREAEQRRKVARSNDKTALRARRRQETL